MKKIIAIVLSAILICIMLCGCKGSGDRAFTSNRFEIITYQHDINYEETILYDRETGVMYVWVREGYGGGLSPLYDSEGNVMLYEK